MSDLSASYLQTQPDEDDVEQSLATLKAARAQDDESSFTERLKSLAGAPGELMRPFHEQVVRLSKNGLIAAFDAVKNTADAVMLMGANSDVAAARDQELADISGVGNSVADRRDKKIAKGVDVVKGAPRLEDVAPEFMYDAQLLRDTLGQDVNSTPDVLIQKALQFAVPFMGTMRAMGVTAQTSKVAAVAAGMVADAVVSWHVWSPDEGRFADLLRSISGDDALVHRATDYLASDPNDDQATARFKNVIDGQITAAVVAGIVKTGAATLRAAKNGTLKLTAEPAPAPAKGK